MKLVFKATGKPVALGDAVTIDGEAHTVMFFRPPHSPASSGKVVVAPAGNPRAATEYYVSVIGAEWIDREDQS